MTVLLIVDNSNVEKEHLCDLCKPELCGWNGSLPAVASIWLTVRGTCVVPDALRFDTAGGLSWSCCCMRDCVFLRRFLCLSSMTTSWMVDIHSSMSVCDSAANTWWPAERERERGGGGGGGRRRERVREGGRGGRGAASYVLLGTLSTDTCRVGV